MTRTNLVDAYDNRSVVAKLVSMEERISGAEDSIEKTVRDGQTSIGNKTDAGVAKISSLLTGLDDTIAKAEAAATTAETASTKAETAAKSVDEDIVAASNAATDAKAYAITGILHDGTAVTSADSIAKSCETYADTAGKSATAASASAADAAASQTAAAQNAGSAEASAKEASGYLDTVKASADAASASASAAAQSAIDADAAAASIDASNLVTLTTEQAISGLKDFTNTGNVMRVASRTTSVAKTDVLNSGDLDETNGKYNNVMHRSIGSNVEPAYGPRALSLCDIGQKNAVHTMATSNPSSYSMTMTSSYTLSYDSYALKKWRMLFTIHSSMGHAVVEAFGRPVLDKTTSSAKYWHIEIYNYNILENSMKGFGESNFKLIFKSYTHYRTPNLYLAFGYDGTVIYGMPFSVEALVAPCEATSVGSSVYGGGLYWYTHTSTTIPSGSNYIDSGEITIPITAYTIPEVEE